MGVEPLEGDHELLGTLIAVGHAALSSKWHTLVLKWWVTSTFSAPPGSGDKPRRCSRIPRRIAFAVIRQRHPTLRLVRLGGDTPETYGLVDGEARRHRRIHAGHTHAANPTAAGKQPHAA